MDTILRECTYEGEGRRKQDPGPWPVDICSCLVCVGKPSDLRDLHRRLTYLEFTICHHVSAINISDTAQE